MCRSDVPACANCCALTRVRRPACGIVPLTFFYRTEQVRRPHQRPHRPMALLGAYTSDAMPGETRYLNTDLVLASKSPLTELCAEFGRKCCVLYHDQGDDGNWYATIESNATDNVSAADDIQKMLSVIPTLSDTATEQWNGCHQRDINIGFDCGETWAYPHSLPPDVVRAVADVRCSLSVTLYPIREDGQSTS
ncbi:MAG: hypothetical protein KatS3mg111_0607 [Pirellulaceae bacterium]|nr:MAG: hypothetical protein KatS3mg111_0607 [Pirellulaceae bacterium]